MNNRRALALLAAGLLLAGCSGSSSDGIGPTDPTSGNGDPGGSTGVGEFRASFNPASGVFPYPTDLYFSGSTDGTLNLPLLQTLPNADELNALDGFSTVAPATARFTAPIDPATISAATVIVLEVEIDNATKATVGFERALLYGTDYEARVAPTVDSGGATLEILPLKPLRPSTGADNFGYLVILTNGLRDTGGNAATPDRDYLAIKSALPTCASLTGSMNGICLLTGAHLQVASAVLGPAIVPSTVLTFSFSTQATQDTMNIAATVAAPTDIAVVGLPLDLSDLNPQLPPVADLYVGSLQINYYLDAAAPLTGRWEAAPGGPPGGVPSTNLTRFNPIPVPKSTLNIPLFVTVPNGNSGQAKPVDGWPVVIFQHGLRGNRLQSAAIAAAYATQGFVVAAIDIPLHGLTETANPFYQAGAERTFDLDLVDNATGAQVPDGIIDPSGSYIINLASLLTSRDNLRQAALDVVQLAKSLPALDLDGDTVPDIDGTRIHFAGLSLGGIVGTVANAMQAMPAVSAYLNAPGGGLANLLRDSEALGPTINAGLAASSPLLQPGTTFYEQFFRDAQTVVDAGDPLNYIAPAVAARPVVLTQVVDDTVVPNSATQRLVNAAPFTKTNAAGPNFVGAGNGTWVHFLSGSHGSLLDPNASLAVPAEMQTEAVSLVATDGSLFNIVNAALLEP